MPLFWTVLTVIFFLAEAATAQLVGIWFACAAFLTLVLTLLGLQSVYAQVCAFVFFTVVLLILTKPLARKLKSKSSLKTNTDALIGKRAVVTERINNLDSAGRVKINGMEWSARAKSGTAEAGSTVEIVGIDGVKLLVKNIEED